MKKLMRATLTTTVFLTAFAGEAQAATTIGSDLAAAAALSSSSSGGDFTFVQRALPGRPVTAPSDGVIVRWRIKVGGFSGTQPVMLRVVRGTGAASTGAGTSEPEAVPSTPGTYTFDTRLAITVGDYIGVDCCGASVPGTFFASTSGAAEDYWLPRLGDGETRAPDSQLSSEMLVNADIEADCDNDGFGDETQDSDTASCNPPPPDPPPPDTPTAHCQDQTVTKRDGTVGNDTLLGTPASEAIFGLGGEDDIDGVDGDDCLDGGEGDDILRGGAGDDLGKGGEGNDKVRGQGGKDKLKGQDGDDRLNGGEGKDKLVGGAGKDKLRGAAAKDTYKGNAGDDKINSVDAKTDEVNCGGGDDRATVDPVDQVSQNCETVLEVEKA